MNLGVVSEHFDGYDFGAVGKQILQNYANGLQMV
jgi:hypothetical protein